ncbi:MAG TPA: hypothetical protein VFF52_27145 [Isosphaeraceae bacterium]|nr:hypothetical protein [Isosphaeraceae bacterium]
MKTVDLGNLPPGTQVRGVLYNDPAHVYGLGDVLEVELPTGLTIDVGWDEDSPQGPFRLTVYREYFGDHFIDFHVRDLDQVVIEVQRLAAELSGPGIVSGGTQTESSMPPTHSAPR